ncbi:putative nuclease HARBI1 [Scomber scombrus]|uniref:putative nuclease HARBI1 n=1 Tax=Scomber scombrus TaxID=13677 RepID=UPI002DDBC22C|nr:putative nuclease HARBI1 [Scomber scombrus]
MAYPFLEEPVDVEAQILRRNLRRERIIRPRLDVLSFPDEYLFKRFCFSASSIIYLNNILSPHLVHMTHRGHALSSEQILCVALRFFANCRVLHYIGDAEHVSKATVCQAVRNVTLALKRLLYTFVVFPSHRPTRLLKEEFHRIAGFPGVIGCIDGTHIPIIAPSINEGDYVNRRSVHSINVQIICDAAHMINNVEAKWPGSVHYSRMFCESTLSARFARGEFDGYRLGDRGYPCQRYLLTPYPGPQQHYNLAHCRTRARVEMTIGMLKARFQCLRRLRVTPERACDIIVACVVLHNIATIREEQCPTRSPNDPDINPDPPADARDGRAVRDMICFNHF